MAKLMLFSDFQSIDDLAADDMGVDDFIDVFIIDKGVPGSLRINHHYRAFFAAFQTTRLVDANLAVTGQTELFDTFFGMFLRRLRAFVGAAGTFAGLTLVQAKKHVVLVERSVGHDRHREAKP
jgi:hypothetical protein